MKENTQQFYLDIRDTQNSSWQGSLQRLDTGETINFRSELEMMILIEEALQNQNKQETELDRFRKWSRRIKKKDETAQEGVIGTGTFGQGALQPYSK